MPSGRCICLPVTITRISIEDARRSLSAEKRWSELQGDWPSSLIYRPLSIWLTPLCVRLGISARAITLSCAALALALPAVALVGGPYAYVVIAALAFVVHVFDCLDGNVARVTGTTSEQGGLLDAFVDICFWSLFLLAIGLLADAQTSTSLLAPGRGVTLALACSTLVLTHRVLRDHYAERFSSRAEFPAQPPARVSLAQWLRIWFIALERTYLFMVLAGGYFARMDSVMLGIAVYITIIFIAALWVTFNAAARQPR